MLKPDRNFDRARSEISYYMGEVAEQGILVSYPTGDVLPPGLDDKDQYAVIPADDTVVPLGILLDNVVDKDLTDCAPNKSRREVQVNNKVEIVRAGWFVTDQLEDGIAPAPGDDMYFIAGGLFSTTAGSAVVGKFESTVDANGFARVYVQL